MSTMECSEFMEQLESWMAGEKHGSAGAHVEDCAACRSLVADLDAIQAAAPALSIADPEPPARVWAALQSQLVDEGLIRERAAARGQVERPWMAGLFAHVPRPALAGAYLSLLVILAFGLTGPLSQQISQETPQATSFPLTAELDHAEQTTVSSFDGSKSAASADLHENLEIVDHYIALCEKSVRDEPQNDAAKKYLYQAYQQKADLLSMITERGDFNQ
jgi:hypothetical protein